MEAVIFRDARRDIRRVTVPTDDLLFRVNDPKWSSPQDCLDSVPDGATVLFQGAYDVPATSFVLKSSGLTIEALGATFTQDTWGAPVFLGLQENGGGDNQTFRLGTATYTGVRGTHTGTAIRGSAPYCSGSVVFVNGDGNLVDRMKSVDFPTPINFSSWTAAGGTAADRTGVGNRIGYFEASGYDFGLLYVKQFAYDWGSAYLHDDIDDSGGVNPTHAIYCSATATARCGAGRVGAWYVENNTGGHAYQFKYTDGLTAASLSAEGSAGVLNMLDCDDAAIADMVGRDMLATGGLGSVSLGFTTNACQRPSFGRILITQASGVNERAVNLWADDADVGLVRVVSNRSSADANNGELVIRGSRNNVAKLRTRAVGSAQMAALLGLGATGALDSCIADVEAFGSSNDAQPVSTFAASTGARWARRSEESWGLAAPTTGTWKRGAIVRNASPSASGVPGWVCVTAGTPGTWKNMAVLSA